MKRILGGSRIIKTGVAILLTAWICELVGWPPVFAVITAIVTIEPTVSASIKKGIVRFPASAIGSAYAVIFISLFGNSPITYTLAAVLTIATCYKLKLHAGLLVATLTSVAMIEVIHGDLFTSFLIRLGTTTIGLVVSTVVNMFVLPPDYRDDIAYNVKRSAKLTANVMKKIYTDILDEKTNNKAELFNLLAKLERKIKTNNTLIHFQKDESKFHPFVANEKAVFKEIEKKARLLQRMHDDLDNLLHTPIHNLNWSAEEKEIIRSAADELAESLKFPSEYDNQIHHENQLHITKIFWEDNASITTGNQSHPTKFPPELILLYELLSFFDLVEKFYENG